MSPKARPPTSKRTRRKTTKPRGAPSVPAAPAAPERAATPEPGQTVYEFADAMAETGVVAQPDVRRQALEPWVMFDLAGERFVMPVTSAREVLRVSTITRVPHAPHPVSGIINVRGRIVPVVNLRTRIGLPPAELGRDSRILITSSQGRMIGLLVDAVHQVIQLDRLEVTDVPRDVMTEQSEYIIGVLRREGHLLLLLDVDAVLTIPQSLRSA